MATVAQAAMNPPGQKRRPWCAIQDVLCAVRHQRLQLRAGILSLYMYDMMVLAIPVAFLVRIGLTSGLRNHELPALDGAVAPDHDLHLRRHSGWPRRYADHRLSGLAPQRAVVAAGADALNCDASEQQRHRINAEPARKSPQSR
ncbi:hypothetical protein [Bradyrhizobium sp. BWA-3-5]|uniref:hypothetical protein n=1 Tax=Bradyrhizobium sp. BWA-3-5 TaxID=3080013 RepID=UPI00293ED45C|nr:hypothetical protein [Bradyrhizobium sp. BWA-3-5]WOH65727.1 hypothetical protein RX331_35225 [Bradyrhizobium sp. BWA-3-5]